MKKSIITGATGFVGNHVYHTLKSEGIDVLAVVRADSNSLKTGDSLNDLNYVVFDLERGGDFRRALQEIGWEAGDDCVFYHFAWSGEGKLTGGDATVQLRNVFLSTEAIKHARAIGCTKFINAGTYEETLLEGYFAGSVNENKPDIASISANYAVAKIANRNMCYLKAYHEKIDYIHTRFSVPISSDGSHDKFVEKQLMDIRKKLPVQTPANKNFLNFIHINDLANAYYELGVSGLNQKDYFIRTDLFTDLATLFDYLKMHKENGKDSFPLMTPYSFSSTDASERHTEFIKDEYSILSHLQKIVTN